MTDGCGYANLAVFEFVRIILCLPELPGSIQFRLAGAKVRERCCSFLASYARRVCSFPIPLPSRSQKSLWCGFATP